MDEWRNLNPLLILKDYQREKSNILSPSLNGIIFIAILQYSFKT